MSCLRDPSLQRAIILLLVMLYRSAATPVESGDTSDIIFSGDGFDVNDVCLTDYPMVISNEVGLSDVTITWTAIPSQNITGYQVLYWRSTSSTYLEANAGPDDTEFTLPDLIGLVYYTVTVRAICGDDQFGVAGPRSSFLTSSRPPSAAPEILNVERCYMTTPEECNQTLVRWNGINDTQWNGIMEHYLVQVADITPDSTRQVVQQVSVNYRELLIGNLEFDHTYLVTVHAVSSGGDGPFSNTVRFTIERPPVEPEETEPFFSNWFYAMIPAAFILATCCIIVIICCKKSSARRVAYVRDIHKNREDGVMPPLKGMFYQERRNSTRSQNRPLPPHPEPGTPSINSIHAHLINDNLSPMTPGSGMNFEMQMRGGMMHHSQPPNGGEVFWTNVPEASTHFPTLSQPMSDFSSGVPSTFAESSIPHTFPEEPQMVPPVNPYLVPNESETGHVPVCSSVSPPSHMQTLPNPRRPHTAVPHGRGYPHGHIVAQSSVDINAAPPVPSHRSNSSLGNLHRQRQEAVSPQITRPDSGLYSEIPNNISSPDTKHVPPTTPSGVPLSSTGNASSIVSSDQYSSYSDIPAACGSPVNEDQLEKRPPAVLQDPYSYPNDLNSQSLSDSVSSFSDDSHNRSPVHEPFNGRPNGRINSCSSYHDRKGSVSSSSKQRLEIEFKEEVYTDPDPTPYLSPMSIVSTEASPP